jgi:hypothetical protein
MGTAHTSPACAIKSACRILLMALPHVQPQTAVYHQPTISVPILPPLTDARANCTTICRQASCSYRGLGSSCSALFRYLNGFPERTSRVVEGTTWGTIHALNAMREISASTALLGIEARCCSISIGVTSLSSWSWNYFELGWVTSGLMSRPGAID